MAKEYFVLREGEVVYLHGHYDIEGARAAARREHKLQPNKKVTVVQVVEEYGADRESKDDLDVEETAFDGAEHITAQTERIAQAINLYIEEVHNSDRKVPAYTTVAALEFVLLIVLTKQHKAAQDDTRNLAKKVLRNLAMHLRTRNILKRED